MSGHGLRQGVCVGCGRGAARLLVVVYGAEGAGFSVRIGDGQWQEVGRDAALLPATATEVRVTPAGGGASTIPLG